MDIGEAIKQKKFGSEQQKLVINVVYTGSWLHLQNVKRLKPYGISPEQFNILRILRGQFPSPSSIQLLIERMLDKSSNASRIVEKLRQKQLLERKECEKDRRLVDVIITDKGLELLQEVDQNEHNWITAFSTITPEEAALASAVLDKLRI